MSLPPHNPAQRSALCGRSSGKNQIFLILFLFVFLAGNGLPALSAEFSKPALSPQPVHFLPPSVRLSCGALRV